MRIMTANIWGDYFNNPVGPRKPAVESVVRRYNPDVVGVQEITEGWYNSGLFEDLGDSYTLVERNPDNYTPLIYKSASFDLIERGWEPFAETPDLSKGITWATLRDKSTQKYASVCNIHFWWKSDSEKDDLLRLKNAEQLFERVKILRQKYQAPVFAFGDFNCLTEEPALKFMAEQGFVSGYQIADHFTDVSSNHGDPVRDENGIYHGSRTQNKMSKSIDHILTFAEGVQVRDYIIVEDQDILDATDHSPVYTDVDLM